MFGIFDVRPKHGYKPYQFTMDPDHIIREAVYSSKEEADAICEKMNKFSRLTSYVVKEI